jgi:hypothetical protein
MAAHRDGFPVRWTARQRLEPAQHRIHFTHVRGISRGMEVTWFLDADGPQRPCARSSSGLRVMMRCPCVERRGCAWALLRLLNFLAVSLCLPVPTTVADDTRVLPQGRWRVSAEARFSLPITQRFTPDGGTEDIAIDFNRELNSTVFTDLSRVETAFRLPASSATFGRSVVDFGRHIQIYTVEGGLWPHGSTLHRPAHALLAPND